MTALHRRLTPDHFVDKTVPELRKLRDLLAGEALVWDLVEAVADVCFPLEPAELTRLRLEAARELWDLAQTTPTPVEATQELTLTREMLAAKDRIIALQEEMQRVQQAYTASERGRQQALQIATLLFIMLGQAQAQVAELQRRVDALQTLPASDAEAHQALERRLSRAQSQQVELRDQLSRAEQERDTAQQVADHAARRIQMLEAELAELRLRMGDDPQLPQEPTLQPQLLQPALPELDPGEAALDDVALTLGKMRAALDEEHDSVQQAADDAGYPTVPASATTHVYRATIVPGQVQRRPEPPSTPPARSDAFPGLSRTTPDNPLTRPDTPALPDDAALHAEQGVLREPTTSERTAGSGRLPQPRIWGNLPPRNRNFTGRAAQLEVLEHHLSKSSATVVQEAILGMGGVGKTQLAIEYAYRRQSTYDIVWWIPAERPGQITQALVELARRLGLETTAEANIAIPAVREALREGSPYSRWLLIFDNAESPEHVRPYFPHGGDGTILVTSRNRRWSQTGESLEVDVFTRPESIQLLHRSGPSWSHEDADMLAEALGDLPLALEQAAAWRAETGMIASDYLRLFESRRSELLEVAPPPDYSLPVAAAWNVSLDHLETRSLGALRLLQLCSYFEPAPISRSILADHGPSDIDPALDPVLNDPLRLARAIREINRYSLARVDHRTNSIEMHRLVQRVLINRMTPEEQVRMREGAHTLLATADPQTPQDPATWPRYAELYGHAVASGAIECRQPWVRELVMNAAKYLYFRGSHDDSLTFSEAAWMTWRTKFGEEDRTALQMGQWFSLMCQVVGRFADAATLADRLSEIYARTTPEDDEDALGALQLKAAVHRIEGEFTAGAESDRKAYERAVRSFGEDDPVTLSISDSLGRSLRAIGDFRQALELDRRTFDLKVRVFGSDHQQTLITQTNVAIGMGMAGHYIDARALYESLLKTYQQAWGHAHPSTIAAMRHLGEACRTAGDCVRAQELATEAYTEFTRRYGLTHPQSLASALTLSLALIANGDLTAAQARGIEACERYRQTYGRHHPHALSADVDLAVTLRLLNQLDDAHHLNTEALTAFTDHLGTDHPLTLVCAVNSASNLAALGRHEEATAKGRDTLDRCRATFGEDHPTTLVCAGNLSIDLAATGSELDAVTLREETLKRMERILDAPLLRVDRDRGPHPDTWQLRHHRRAACLIDPLPL
ncbi:FxSxx-COOH system tetratricopeptide repeat protein [Streptomyces sp. NPDC058964]|uniref:FxSxx-COOH system tetratricopeptide repeat protein n=1 Tax=Streptomyces sp. NPDC058964 TaxID=3346681 RepID=UPI003677D3DE